MKTAVEILVEQLIPKAFATYDVTTFNAIEQAKQIEKEQIQKAFSDGQETPINHPTLPHYSREEYYDDNYKPETI
jgi:hypothetical protein